MSYKTKKFLVVKKDLPGFEDINIEKDDVGILISQSKTDYLVFSLREGKEFLVDKEHARILDIDKVGDDFSKKICDRCHKLLPTKVFQKNQNAKGDRPVRRPSCNNCRKIIDGKKVSEKIKRKWKDKKPHHEAFVCPVCGKTTIAGITKIVLDHDHKTGEVRGWLCDSCNTGMGRFKDDIKILKRAIDYLEKKKRKEG